MTGWCKRCLDIIGAGIGLVFLAPVMLAIAVLIRIRMGRPVLFCQKRGGLHGQPFTLIKFRTMRRPDEVKDEVNLSDTAKDTPGQQSSGTSSEHGLTEITGVSFVSEEERIPPLGRWLRRTHLDELPELWNVLRGDMSLVGPRPLLAEYSQRYTPAQQRRHLVKPGLTGWTQIHGGNALSWEEKFAYDLWYVEHQSVWLDLKILWLTLWQWLFRKKTAALEPVVASEFLGAPRDKNQQDGVQKRAKE